MLLLFHVPHNFPLASSIRCEYNCTACSAGSIADGLDFSSTCAACGLGTQQPLDGTETCELCAAGTFANETGTALCAPCGLVSISRKRSMQISVVAIPYTPCRRFRLLPYERSFSSFHCLLTTRHARTPFVLFDAHLHILLAFRTLGPMLFSLYIHQGTATAIEGQAECSACEVGTYADVTGSLACLACPNGTVATQTGAHQCEYCSAGKVKSESRR